jgi:uncharacterized protein (TIGR01777 family)
VKIIVSGASGLIGSELVSTLVKNKHQVVRLVRKEHAAAGEIRWNPLTGDLDKKPLEGVDAVVHLAGENIAAGPWTAERKRQIRESRILGTRLIAQSIAHLFEPPKIFISVSATGYYGDRGEEMLNEDSGPGKGFLCDLCREWEEAALPAIIRGIRVVIPRLGMVLSGSGGALPRMLPLYQRGLGGIIGSGAQYMSWIELKDLIGIITYAIRSESIHGPINAVSPNPVTNRDFNKILSRILAKPAFLRLPGLAARIILGEMAKEALLASARAIPAKLIKSKYKFQFPDLEGALRHVLRKPEKAN